MASPHCPLTIERRILQAPHQIDQGRASHLLIRSNCEHRIHRRPSEQTKKKTFNRLTQKHLCRNRMQWWTTVHFSSMRANPFARSTSKQDKKAFKCRLSVISHLGTWNPTSSRITKPSSPKFKTFIIKEKQRTPHKFEVGDVVYVKSSSTRLDQWPLSIVTKVFESSDGVNRSVTLRTLNRGNIVEKSGDQIQKWLKELYSISTDRHCRTFSDDFTIPSQDVASEWARRGGCYTIIIIFYFLSKFPYFTDGHFSATHFSRFADWRPSFLLSLYYHYRRQAATCVLSHVSLRNSCIAGVVCNKTTSCPQ